MRVAELCAGYGGLYQSMRLAGWPVELAWVAENDPDASKVLEAQHPGVPNVGDITTADFAAMPPVDVVAAGFPCQDVSSAGARAGLAPGTRSGLWAHVARAVDTIRPKIVFLENVRGLLSARAHSNVEPCPWCVGDEPDEPALRALGAVLGDLADLGYDTVWQSVPAAAVGAPHLRWRVFIVAFPAAYSESVGHGDGGASGVGGVSSSVVGGGVAAGGVSLLPTPAARLGDRWGQPNAETAQRRMGVEGRRNLEDAVALLPTPRASDTNGAGAHGSGGIDLRTAVDLLPTPRARDHNGRDPNPRGVDLHETVALLPTPAARDWKSGESNIMDRNARPLNEVIVNLLPTPRATDGTKGGPNQRGSSGDLMLPSAVVQLLPPPTATPYGNNQSASDGSAVRPSLNSLAATDRWGQYAPAITRWEQVIGRPAPDPTEPGRDGNPRLAAPFVEWLMGLPDGRVTGVVGRNAALRILGNGVVPLQGALGLRLIAPYLPQRLLESFEGVAA